MKKNKKNEKITITLTNGEIRTISDESPSAQDLVVLRHSTAHIMAEAVKDLFPSAKIAIGPAIENGYYYDFDFERPFTPDDLERIEERMHQIVDENIPFVREDLSREEAISLFLKYSEPYKVELLREIPEDTVSIYRQNGFTDLCRGPHLSSTGLSRYFKLTGVAGAYWRGSEHNPMLQRIYGTAFFSEKALNDYLEFLEEAKRRDHRRLGKELELFSISEEAGAGLVIYHPKGAMLRTIIEDFEKREHLKRGYQIVMGPQILRVDLWKRSGHFENYRENMYFTEVDSQAYGIKPMNCLAHMLIYKSKLRSYRDLPLRFFELGTVLRHEKSGVLHGLLRVRQFTQDDAHIICTPGQLHNEIKGVIDFVISVMEIFGFEYEVEISTRPEKSIGTDEDWERATSALMEALQDKAIPFAINEGDGAFYGPKIDIKLKDALGRRWQCATIQCDFTLPERFDLTYIGSDGEKHRPVMLHRVILGALERFIGVLIEHYAGAFPVWLAPVQVIVLTVTDDQADYARFVLDNLLQAGIRAESDFRNEKLSLKIREAQLQKIPYMLILGKGEVSSETVTVRYRTGENIKDMKQGDFIALLKSKAENYQ